MTIDCIDVVGRFINVVLFCGVVHAVIVVVQLVNSRVLEVVVARLLFFTKPLYVS